MRSMIILAALLSAAAPAAASGGISCNVEDDPSVKLLVESGVTRGMGSPLFQFKGQLEILDKKVEADLRKTEFAQEHVAQYWLDQNGLKLLLYRERVGEKPHGYVELTIETQAGDEEGMFNGPYKLTVFDTTGGDSKTIGFTGQTYCFVE